MSILSGLTKYPRLAMDLRKTLKQPISFEQSKKVISQRFKDREKNFINLVETGIYQNPRSPYRQLLAYAGCELGDIKSLVNKDGIEATLQTLLDKGVYIGWEEFKGKREVIRGSTQFHFTEKDFDNPYSANYYQMRSSGSRSAGTRTNLDFKHRAETAHYAPLGLESANTLDYPMVVWFAQLPSAAGIFSVINYAKMGRPVIKWFSPVKPGNVKASFRDRLANNFIIYSGRFFGAKLVKPEYVSLENAEKIALFIAKVKKISGGCNVSCFVSQAVKICQTAIDKGLDIQGVQFFVAGEPLTVAKKRQIQAAGASVTPRYHITEFGTIGYGCLNATTVDDIHLFHDTIAAITHHRPVEHTDMMVDAFVFTGLLASSPKIIFNVETDDFGTLETRSCGCFYDKLGFKQHLSNIRSYAKLTGSGMTIVGSDLVYILEEILPQKYGGSAADYQIIEEEDEKGQTHLNLIISPTIENVDENGAIDTILKELRRDIHGGKLAAGFWSQINTLQVKRDFPKSSRGKVLTLHLSTRNKQ